MDWGIEQGKMNTMFKIFSAFKFDLGKQLYILSAKGIILEVMEDKTLLKIVLQSIKISFLLWNSSNPQLSFDD